MSRRLLPGAVLVSLLALSFGWGFLAHRYRIFPFPELRALYHAATGKPDGRWRAAARQPGPLAAADDAAAGLLALPYLQGYSPAPPTRNVTVHREDLAYRGLNLYVSGHAPEAVLIDMSGRELHRWSLPYEKVWSDRNDSTGARYWRRAHALPNGDLLAIFEGIGLVKVDRDSRLLWSYRGGCHHDLFVTDAGEIHVLTREARVVPSINPTEPTLEDFVTVLDPEGRTIRRLSLLQALEGSPFSAMLGRVNREKAGDILHTNAIDVLDGSFRSRAPAFRSGNLLVSMLYLDAIAIVDPERERVVWALSGMWRRQHQPTFLDDGRMLLFDNRGRGGHSRVLEFDPLTQEVLWTYGEAPGQDLYSEWNGSSQRLPNGNTLITESDAGRAVEVTREGEIVWEFFNPHRAGERQELIATLFEVVRLPPDSALATR